MARLDGGDLPVLRDDDRDGLSMKLALVFAILTALALTMIASNPARADVADLLRQEAIANSACRGRNVMCDERDRIFDDLKKNGYCWGYPDQIEADKFWHRCNMEHQIPETTADMAFNVRIDRAIDEVVAAVMTAPRQMTDEQRERLVALINGK